MIISTSSKTRNRTDKWVTHSWLFCAVLPAKGKKAPWSLRRFYMLGSLSKPLKKEGCIRNHHVRVVQNFKCGYDAERLLRSDTESKTRKWSRLMRRKTIRTNEYQWAMQMQTWKELEQSWATLWGNSMTCRWVVLRFTTWFVCIGCSFFDPEHKPALWHTSCFATRVEAVASSLVGWRPPLLGWRPSHVFSEIRNCLLNVETRPWSHARPGAK